MKNKSEIKCFTEEQINFLLNILKDREMTYREIRDLLHIEDKKLNRTRILMESFGNHYPIYESEDIFGVGLLNNRVLDKYEEEHKTKLEELYAEYDD